MRLISSTILLFQPRLGKRYLKEQLNARDVKTPLSEGCLQELVTDAMEAAGRRAASSPSASYPVALKEELAVRAEFIRQWTDSDEPVDAADDNQMSLVRIARKYALPRPWKLSEPVAATSAARPSYWKWASAGADIMPQT